MNKAYAVFYRDEPNNVGYKLIGVFADEGTADRTAESHATKTRVTWVEETKYYE